MKSFIFRFLSVFLIAVPACKKDQLEGQMATLKGKWEWTETFEVRNYCDLDSLWNYQQIDYSRANNQFTMEFQEKGKLIFYHNDAVLWKERIVFDSEEQIQQNKYTDHFVILLNNNPKDRMEVWVGPDSLLLNDFPKDADQECSEMFNHFIRMQ
jgi:hypothetical protein